MHLAWGVAPRKVHHKYDHLIEEGVETQRDGSTRGLGATDPTLLTGLVHRDTDDSRTRVVFSTGFPNKNVTLP